ncbi:zinc-binding dehydrogenase [Modestobacter excelsi]|uniref:zinc-binding dehydrogenase n=1 Tax=Modestobacter excelsi TaxID=2213161 RepID=UPI001FE6DEE2|nr:zinc-binding dehydrogenase [Modestobacter excelsi]
MATALIRLGSAAGYRVWVTGRSEDERAAALALGADHAFESGARLPERVDGVMETVGEATWSHSITSLRPGGVVVTCGATTGFNPGAELNRVFFTQLSVIGSTMRTREELDDLIQMCLVTGVRPQIDVQLPLAQAREGFQRMLEDRTAGKIVFTL